MDLAQLQIFVTVVREGGIVKAARKLHRVASNVTTRVKQLEDSVGAALRSAPADASYSFCIEVSLGSGIAQ